MGPASNTDPKAQKILVAVRTILAQNGYMGTTISLVAKEAGVSRGLLHYYFKNKDEMLAQVIKENMEVSITMIAFVFEQHHTPQGYAKGITELLRGVMENDPDFLSLFFEGFAVARHSKIVNQELAMLYGKFRNALETCLKKAEARQIIHPGLPVEALAAIITGMIDGMGLQLLTEPDLSQNLILWESIETAIVDLLCKDR
ncbi:MAG: TetR/AcrR family transcriptional regulator [Proteobacteria bacterium]|nr:TetR/AcrR family transcriptional regulator [Pseudomonadota bacterium]MBU1585752.1 TetR/AcrR family transcriptional regulator [Pseudomonadota bacterium]MBU2627899.1 TetR/AcrR family transcriptional regulator [Pseudomonadota bacterium]